MAAREHEDLRKALLDQGLWEPEFESFEDFFTELVKRGGWCDPSASLRDAGRHFMTVSGRYEFYVRRLQSMIDRAGGDPLFAAMGVAATGDRRFLPHQEPAAVPTRRAGYPLLLNVYRLPTLSGRHGTAVPLLQERPSVRIWQAHWTAWVEMNPATAKDLGVRDGDAVWVESDRGRMRTVAFLDPGVRRDAVNAPVRHGVSAAERRAKDRAGNPLDLVWDGEDTLLGSGVLNQTMVKVYRE